MACGTVSGKNGFGAMTGQQRFIYAAGNVAFEDDSSRFARNWNIFCVSRLSSKAPDGAAGHRFGSGPTGDLRRNMPTTFDKLDMYVPRGQPAPFEGIALVQEDFRYDHRHLYGVTMTVAADKRDVVKAALVKLYGAPLTSNDDAGSYTWSWPKRNVRVLMTYNDTIKQAQVIYAHGDY